MADQTTDAGKCPFRPRNNRDWWPNQLNLQVLRQNSPKSNPMGEGFDYREEFKTRARMPRLARAASLVRFCAGVG